MVLKFFYTSVPSTTALQKKQERIKMVLTSFKLDVEMIDISATDAEENRKFMRANAKSRTSTPALPPQLFNDETYCGDYVDFEDAIESNNLMAMLKLETQVSQATVTLSEKKTEETDKTDADTAEDKEKVDENVGDKETSEEVINENGKAEESDDKPTEQVCEQDTEQVSEQDTEQVSEQDGDKAGGDVRSDDKVNIETSDDTDKKDEDAENDSDKKDAEDSTAKSDEEPEDKNKSDEEQQQVQE